MKMNRHSDISIVLCTLLLKTVGLWTAEDHAEARRRKAMIAGTLTSSIVSIIIEIRDCYFTYIYKPDDVPYVATNILTISMALIKIYIILMNKVKFLDLLTYVQEKFWNAEYNYHEEKIMNDCRRICTLFIFGVSLIAGFVFAGYMVNPIFMHDNTTQWTLPFKCWMKLTATSYSIMMVIEVINLYIIGVCYFCFDNILCIMAIHLSGQFRILQYRLKVLYHTEHSISEKDPKAAWLPHIDRIYAKLKDCVRQHQALIDFCDRLEDVYTIIILLQVLMSSVLICMFGYQIFLADIPSARRSIFVFLLVGSMYLLFMFTYSCDTVIQGSGDIAIGAYSAMWTKIPMNRSGRMIRTDLIMIIKRSRRACCLTANGFFPVSLETYTSILSTAMSYFTLMKNNVENTSEIE